MNVRCKSEAEFMEDEKSFYHKDPRYLKTFLKSFNKFFLCIIYTTTCFRGVLHCIFFFLTFYGKNYVNMFRKFPFRFCVLVYDG